MTNSKEIFPPEVQQHGWVPQELSVIYDSGMMRRILGTHDLKNYSDFDMKRLIDIVAITFDVRKEEGQFNDCNFGNMVTSKINDISCEILGNCSRHQDTDETTLDIFHEVSSFSWSAKAIIALAAFAVNYGEFELIRQCHHQGDLLAKSLSGIQKLAEAFGEMNKDVSKLERPMKDLMKDLMKAILNLTECIYESTDILKHIKMDLSASQDLVAHIPLCTYWIVRSIVCCQSLIIDLAVNGYEDTISSVNNNELTTLCEGVTKVEGILKKHIERHRFNRVYKKIEDLSKTAQDDRKAFLKALVSTKEEKPQLLYNGSNNNQEDVNKLDGRIFLLYISHLEPSSSEVLGLKHMYKKHMYEDGKYAIIWMPMVDTSTLRDYETRKTEMPWYLISDPALLDPVVVAYIKKVWHFDKASIIVVLDGDGRVINSNAMHMILVWPQLAFPFSAAREAQLWSNETWRQDFLIGSDIEPRINQWFESGKVICFYGGEDIEWIRAFINTTHSAEQTANLSVEMLYLGNSNAKKEAAENIKIIKDENLRSHVVSDLNIMKLFWLRIQSMWRSRLNCGMSTGYDPITQEIFSMLSFDRSNRGWAIFSSQKTEMVKGMGDTMQKCLEEIDNWKEHIKTPDSFIPALTDYIHQQVVPTERCNTFDLSETESAILHIDKVPCFECGNLMKKSITYNCCGVVDT